MNGETHSVHKTEDWLPPRSQISPNQFKYPL